MKAIVLGFLLLSATSQAADVPVCERTQPIVDFLASATAKTCAEITATDLESIKRIDVSGKNITAFKDGDFSGFPNLEILNLRNNPFTQLNPGLFAELPKLTTLVLISTGLTSLPDDFLEKNPLMEELILFRVPLKQLPESVWERFDTFQNWKDVEFDKTLDDANNRRLSKTFRKERGITLVLH